MALPAPLPRPRPGLVVYVSVPDGTAAGELAEAAELLRELAGELLPGADTYAALSLAPTASDDVHRLGDRLSHLRLLDHAEDAG